MKTFARAIAGCILALLALAPQGPAWGAATLLPPAVQCFSALSATSGGPGGTGTGFIGLLGTITGGTGGTAGTYGGVALTGGSGSGATANITVSGGAVTAIAILNPGTAYVVGDVLSATSGNIGNVSGFSVPVLSVAINSSLAGGTVTMYVPNTTTFKQTWFNADQASNHQNTNPVTLDANGCAVIYGTGSYRQILKDSLGNTVWDQITTDTSANNNTFWAGLAAGAPNAITVVDAGFNATDGSIIQFIPVSTNTGATTLTPSGIGVPVAIVKDTATGAVALQGGEIVANSPSNVVSVVYSAAQANFHLLNLVNTTAPTTVQTMCGATGLRITNNSGTPNSQIAVTADLTTVTNPSALTVSRAAVSYTLNITLGNVTAAANGMDGEAPGASAWLYIWLIDNGSGGAALGSLSATAPTMPSGYTYKCRLGAMRVDGSGNLMRTIQLGPRVQYTVQVAGGGGNTTGALLNIANGTAGTSCGSNGAVYVTQTVAAFVPPTATSAEVIAYNNYNSGSVGFVLVASNINYGGTGTGTNSPYAGLPTATAISGQSLPVDVFLEVAQQVAWCSSASGGAIFAAGWKDKVNAN